MIFILFFGFCFVLLTFDRNRERDRERERRLCDALETLLNTRTSIFQFDVTTLVLKARSGTAIVGEKKVHAHFRSLNTTATVIRSSYFHFVELQTAIVVD